MEEYRLIKGFKNYEVSNLGNVRRIGSINNLKPSKDKKGYLRVYLSIDCKQKTIRVHQLVAIAFLNHTPCGMSLLVDHKDENKLNNNYLNLQLINNRENVSKSKINCSSIYTGVCFDKSRKKWSAEIRIGKKRKKLGRFEQEIDAHNAYQKELNEL